jgi:hypothetical protein
MNEMIKTPIADEEVFAALRPKSLGEIRRQCESQLDGTALRDTRSAFRFIEQKLGANLDAVPGTASEVRSLLERITPALADVSPKRLENIKSLIRKAVERFGSRRVWITREVALSPEWEALMKPDRRAAASLGTQPPCGLLHHQGAGCVRGDVRTH